MRFARGILWNSLTFDIPAGRRRLGERAPRSALESVQLRGPGRASIPGIPAISGKFLIFYYDFYEDFTKIPEETKVVGGPGRS